MPEDVAYGEAYCVACFDGVGLTSQSVYSEMTLLSKYLCLARSGERTVVAADIAMLDIVERAIADHRTEGTNILIWSRGLAVDNEAFEVVVSASKRGD